MEREVGTQEGLEIPSYQYTYDPTGSLLRSEAFEKNSACIQHGHGTDMVVCAMENESVPESLFSKKHVKTYGGSILFAFRIVKTNDFYMIFYKNYDPRASPS